MNRLAVFLCSLFAALSFASPCDAASPVRFHVESVSFVDGAAVVEGVILNEKMTAVQIGAAEIIAQVTDNNGDALLDEVYQFGHIGMTIPANEVEPYAFTLPSEGLAAPDGRFQWRIQSRLKWKEA